MAYYFAPLSQDSNEWTRPQSSGSIRWLVALLFFPQPAYPMRWPRSWFYFGARASTWWRPCRRRRGYGYHHDLGIRRQQHRAGRWILRHRRFANWHVPVMRRGLSDGVLRQCYDGFNAPRLSHSQPIRQLLSQLRNTSGISTSILLVEARSLATSLTGIRASRSRA
jgi:hypothetical protein